MFTTRLISGGSYWCFCPLSFVGQGGILLLPLRQLISIIGLFELYRALDMQQRPWLCRLCDGLLLLMDFLWFEGQRYMTLMIIASLMAMMALYVFTFPEYKTEEIHRRIFGVCYVPSCCHFCIRQG